MRDEYADFPANPVLPVIRIALVASEETREALYQLLDSHLPLLRRATLVAPQATAILCEARFGLSISWINREPLGGASHVAELVSQGSLDAVIFLRDANSGPFHNADGTRLMDVCDTRRVPIATNLGTAHALLSHLERSSCSPRLPLVYEGHEDRDGEWANPRAPHQSAHMQPELRSPMMASPEAKAVARTRKRTPKTYVPPKAPLLLGEVGND